MAAKAKPVETPVAWYGGADVPMRAIRQFSRAVAAKFEPDKIILFGSYAYGTPHDDSDVDILVVMPCRSQHAQAVKIRLAVPRTFALDLLVRQPENLDWRLREGESFHTEIVARGIVLHEKEHARVGEKGRSRPARLRTSRDRPNGA
jgi:uncharacterized protein